MKAYNLQEALKNPEKVRALFIHKRRLQSWPQEIWTLSQLEVLDLSENELSDIPFEQLARLGQLKNLNLSGNQIQVIESKGFSLPQLRVLDLSKNQLTAFPKLASLFPHLESLDLSENVIEKINIDKTTFRSLSQLNLRKNKLKKIPAQIAQLSALRQLNLADNKIKELPSEIGECRQLEKLEISGNGLKNLPSTLGQCGALYHLNLRNNQLNHIPKEFSHCRQLQYVDLSRNKLEGLPEGFSKLQVLRELDLSENKLKALPPAIQNCGRLRRLRLNKNEITHFPTKLDGFEQLEELALQYNQIKALPENIGHLQHLEELLLRQNPIEVFPKTLVQLYRLRKANGLKHFDPQSRLLPFLKNCRKERLASALAWPYYQLLSGNFPALSLVDLWTALQFPMIRLRQQALEVILKNHSLPLAEHPLVQATEIACLGQLNLKKQTIKKELQEKKISYTSKLSANTSHVVLGPKAPYPKEGINRPLVFVREQELYHFLRQASAQWLAPAEGRQIRKLANLLLSREEESIELAFQMLKGGGVPKELLTELFLASRSAKRAALKKGLRDLLQMQVSSEAAQKLQAGIPLHANLSAATRTKNIQILCAETPLITSKIEAFLEKV